MHASAPRPPEILRHGPATLRRWRPDDQEPIYLAVVESQDHLRPWMPWAMGYTRENAAEFIAGCDRDWELGVAFNYAILVAEAVAGSCGLMARIGPRGLEIGYWVHRAYVRRGLATAATAALTSAAFALPGIDRVEIVHDELNGPSEAVPRKLGFSRVGQRMLDITPDAGSGLGIVWRLDRRAAVPAPAPAAG
ncbi:MAG TPA: GNAT family N-acetyltransferase [Streptosporangiaceae bacterium]